MQAQQLCTHKARSLSDRRPTPCFKLPYSLPQKLCRPRRHVAPIDSRWSCSNHIDVVSQVSEQQVCEESVDSPSNLPPSDDALSLIVQVVRSIEEVNQEQWDTLVNSYDEQNPFLLWSFLHALEASKSATRDEGWLPHHLIVKNAAGKLVGACPIYLKSHSYGEYVFDHSWAEYSERALGEPYYPKLQVCVPFTPVTGQRLMAVKGPLRRAVLKALGQAIIEITDAMELSGAHITFSTQEEWEALGEAGYLQRTGVQYHWDNAGYGTFDDFLGDLRSNRRKSIRQERRSIEQSGLKLRRLSGREVGPAQWDVFYQFYLDTVDKKWGTAYLTREFFHRIGESMPDQVLLVVAEDSQEAGGQLVAGALNMVGSHALYGRNWGCLPGREIKNLHFELCYYQALEEAIARKLPRVEAGAQGEHKMQRGYLPSRTYSAHYIREPALRRAVAMFLRDERMQMEVTWQALTVQASPFKKERTLDTLQGKLEQYGSVQLVRPRS